MSIKLSKPIAAYFAADKRDGGATAQCFIENGVVMDEGHTYRGRAAIQQWKTGVGQAGADRREARPLPEHGRAKRGAGSLDRQLRPPDDGPGRRVTASRRPENLEN